MRSGKEYQKMLSLEPRQIWLNGHLIKDVTAAPEFSNILSTMKMLYDLQFEPSLRSEMAFKDPTTNSEHGLSFLIPKTKEDLVRRGKMISHWAISTHGMMGRSPDFVNVNLSAWSAAASFFGSCKPEFAQNIVRYHEFVRNNDLALTHSVVNLQKKKDASVINAASGFELQVMKENSNGLIVSGSRLMATMAPLCDEVAIYPGRAGGLYKSKTEQALCFAIPLSTPGLSIVCRENFDQKKSHWEHPMSSRYEQSDAVLFFKDVLVPWDRVFLFNSTDHANQLHLATGSVAHSAHQSTIKSIAKTEFILGLALVAIETYGSDEATYIQQMIADIVIVLETMKGLRISSEHSAKIDEWGVMRPETLPLEVARVVYMQAYPKMIEILKLIASNNLMLLPGEGDFNSDIAEQLNFYLSTESTSALERVGLNRILWEMTCSPFGSREELYERFYAGGVPKSQQFLFKIFPEDVAQKLKARLDYLK